MRLLKKIYNLLFLLYFKNYSRDTIFILINKNENSIELQTELLNRFNFYFKDFYIKPIIKVVSKFNLFTYFFKKKIKLIYGFEISISSKNIIEKSLFFDIDFKKNFEDGWNWHKALNKISFSDSELSDELFQSKKRFLSYFKNLTKKEKAYILGTGPSLANAIDLNWDDGYKIVCNTIVKDEKLWNHIDPDYIVAGDAIYHFGDNGFAISFIKDLKSRLLESKTMFIYPVLYHSFVSKQLPDLKDRLIPIPSEFINYNLKGLFDNFVLPSNNGNVLNILLLPLATSISKSVFLFGFDGRAPSDKLFWSNSKNHSYSDKLQEIIDKHPKFFEVHVPQGKESDYVQKVHGEHLDNILIQFENQGWNFTMMHKTWTETLAKRIK
jgi:hypothetical protein